MNAKLKFAIDERMDLAKKEISQGHLDKAFSLLEEAHVLSQRYVVPHTQSHCWMLLIGFKKRNWSEVIGQLLRIPTGILGSAVGIIPTGNTGGSNLFILKRLPIEAHLQALLDLDQ